MPIRMLKARTAAAAQTSPRDLGGSKNVNREQRA